MFFIRFLLVFIFTTPSDFVRTPLLKKEEGKFDLLHAFHTSLTEIQYNQKEKSLEISIRVFTDDFETALTKANGGKKVFLGGKNDNADEIIKKYIPQHFAVINSQKQKKTINILGKEFEGDATWIYVEIPNYQPVMGDILQNDLLQELFDDQTNLVNFFYLKQKKTFLFDAKTKSAEISF